jgi:CRISPR/Cas system CSM-associated protein Csm3 (group 7 of RAMP superfamily)
LESAPTTNEAEKVLAGVFESAEQKPAVDLEGLDSPENEDELWNKTLRELGNDEEMNKETVATRTSENPFAAMTEEAPKQPVMVAPVVSPEQLEGAFRELAETAVKEFMASKASNIFREEVSKAIGEHVKEIFETQYEKAFRDEISKMIAESFGKAMPQMLGIMEKITLQITPKIAEQMIKTAIEQIKGGEIN